MLSNWTAQKASGAALILGSLGMMVTYLLRPGLFFEASFQAKTRLSQAILDLVEYPTLTHVTGSLGAASVVLMVAGLLAIWPLLGNRGTDAVARWGFAFLAVFAVGSVIAHGLAHIITHIIVHGNMGLAEAVRLVIPLEGAKSGIRLMTSAAHGLGAAALALGLAPRLPAGPYRWIAWGVALVALVGAGFAIAVGHTHTLDNRPMQTITVVVVSLWFTLLGALLMRGDGDSWADDEG
jgi:hypothetical protein